MALPAFLCWETTVSSRFSYPQGHFTYLIEALVRSIVQGFSLRLLHIVLVP